jgi:hypothetical protein
MAAELLLATVLTLVRIRSGALAVELLPSAVLTPMSSGLEVRPFALLLGAALTLVLAHTTQSETSTMVAIAMLIMLRLCFILTIHLIPASGACVTVRDAPYLRAHQWGFILAKNNYYSTLS